MFSGPFFVCGRNKNTEVLRNETLFRRSLICFVIGFVFTSLSHEMFAARAGVENSVQTVLQADRAFVQAAAQGDSAAVARFLDTEFTWTNAEGKTSTKAEVLSSLPAPAAGAEGGAQLQHRDYGQVIAILSTRDKIHVLRIWTKRGTNWRLPSSIMKSHRRNRRRYRAGQE